MSHYRFILFWIGLMAVLCVPACNSTQPGADGGVDASLDSTSGDDSTGDAPARPAPRIIINGDTKTTHGYLTTAPGKALTFMALFTCPPAQSCTYSWDFGDGKKATGEKPAALSYGIVGLYTVTLEVRGKGGSSLGQTTAMVTVWNGKMIDAFNRTSLDPAKHLWLQPGESAAKSSIVKGWLYQKHDLQNPGSSALMATPLQQNVHLEVDVARSQDKATEHTTSILLRVSPSAPLDKYYLLQVRESGAADDNTLWLSLHKVNYPGNKGIKEFPPLPKFLSNFDPERKKNFRVIVDIGEDPDRIPTFNVSLVEAANSAKILLRLDNIKDMVSPLSYAGFAGLTHEKGESRFDNFSLQATTLTKLDGRVDAMPPDTLWVPDAAVPDAAVPDAAVPDQLVPDAAVPDQLVPDAAVPDQYVPDQYVPDQYVPDQLVPDLTLPKTVEIMLNNDPSATHGHATTLVGGSVTFTGLVNCVPALGCTYSWNFGNGQTGTGLTPAAVTYSTAGLYHVTFTVRDKTSFVLGQATATVTVWTGKHSDNFNRLNVDWDAHLWLKPIHSGAVYTINNQWLRVTHNLGLPGSTAIRSSPLVRNVNMAVVINRSTVTTTDHYSDVIFRMHPKDLQGRFYRVRIKEGPAVYNNEVTLTIFKIVTAVDEHGNSLTPEVILAGYDPARKQPMLIKINLQDDTAGVPTFNVTMAAASNPTKVLLQLNNIKDTTKPPHSYAGFVGLTQYQGYTEFDDFVMQSLP